MADTTPSWINCDFVEKALRSNEQYSDITVTSCVVEPAVAAGKNFASEMYRVIVKTKQNGRTEDMSVIVKCALQSGSLIKVIQESDVFTLESAAFTKIHTPLFRMLEKVVGNNFQPFAAKCLYTSMDPETIVLEDLKRQGFTLATVTHGLDLNHCFLVVRTIALYHAASMVMRFQNPDLFQTFRENFITKNAETGLSGYSTSCVRTLKQHVEKWPGYEKYAEFLGKIETNAMKIWANGFRREDNAFNLLIHGDLWLNNLMFRYSQGDVLEDIRLVDFQLSYIASPAVDLMYFMGSSAAPEVLENHHILIDEYYNTLCHTLSSLGHQDLQPTRATLDAELKKKQIFGVLTSCKLLPVALADKNNVPDVDKLLNAEYELPMSESYKETMKKLLPLYEKWGWLEL